MDSDDVIERTLCQIHTVHAFQIPPRTRADGYMAAEWQKEVWAGPLKVVQRGKECAIQLTNAKDGKLFAMALVKEGTVERTIDSSRYFVIKIENKGRHAFIGIAFNDRNEAFDFNVALQEFKKDLEREEMIESGVSPFDEGPKLDLSLKQGEKIKVKVPKRQGGSEQRQRRAGRSGGAGLGGGGLLAPPPSDTKSTKRGGSSSRSGGAGASLISLAPPPQQQPTSSIRPTAASAPAPAPAPSQNIMSAFDDPNPTPPPAVPIQATPNLTNLMGAPSPPPPPQQQQQPAQAQLQPSIGNIGGGIQNLTNLASALPASQPLSSGGIQNAGQQSIGMQQPGLAFGGQTYQTQSSQQNNSLQPGHAGLQQQQPQISNIVLQQQTAHLNSNIDPFAGLF